VVTVSAGGASKASAPVNVTVKTSAPPTVRFTVSPSTINYGDKLPLNATATGSECTNPVTIRYTASEGTIAGTTFDSSGVSFDMSNRLKQQSKTVTLTATATDAKRQTANATANVTINLRPEASRKDIVFANRSARVNNAAKRYLIEELTPQLRADPGSTVILIGHRDASEGNTRAAKELDTQRVLNAAAVLSAGKGVCPSLDLSRIQVAEVGTDQATPPMPFADSSVKERRGQDAAGDRAQYRRVEVWFIPSGADKPSIPGLSPAPEKEIKAKGCPR
jgi:outer membrane protein OmpA-like peptidoglycan-associated protein